MSRPNSLNEIELKIKFQFWSLNHGKCEVWHSIYNSDYAVVGSDSGRIVILEYNATKNTLDKVHQETFGKSGCRRIVPGQYLAIDPKGRAVMIGAIEKQKLVYVLNRDTEARLTISSPLEAHKSSTLTYHMIGVDVGFENPMFACLEIDYEKADSDPTGKEHLMSALHRAYFII